MRLRLPPSRGLPRADLELALKEVADVMGLDTLTPWKSIPHRRSCMRSSPNAERVPGPRQQEGDKLERELHRLQKKARTLIRLHINGDTPYDEFRGERSLNEAAQRELRERLSLGGRSTDGSNG